jgi:hypothetical protein
MCHSFKEQKSIKFMMNNLITETEINIHIQEEQGTLQ